MKCALTPTSIHAFIYDIIFPRADMPDSIPPADDNLHIGDNNNGDNDERHRGDSESDELTIDFPRYQQSSYEHSHYSSGAEVPDDLELGQSENYPGLGIWTKCDVPTGTRFGPLSEMSCHPDDPTDSNNKVSELVHFTCHLHVYRSLTRYISEPHITDSTLSSWSNSLVVFI